MLFRLLMVQLQNVGKLALATVRYAMVGGVACCRLRELQPGQAS